jgi:hypothetical protein
MKRFTSLSLLAGGILGAAPVAGASFPYHVQPIVRIGDRLGGRVVQGGMPSNGLSDSGRLRFETGAYQLYQYEAGQVVPIAVPGGEGPVPGGRWPAATVMNGWGSVNERGDFVFEAGTGSSDFRHSLYEWDAVAGQVRPVTLDGLPAEQRLSWDDQPFLMPMINNNGDMALPIEGKTAAGQRQVAVYFRGRDGKMQPIALPDQMLPDGHQVLSALPSSINDTGAVVFGVRSKDRRGQSGVYLWEGGTITPILGIGASVPGLQPSQNGGALFGYNNSKDRTVLVFVRNSRDESANLRGVYRWADGVLTPVAVVGDPMPGDGRLAIMSGSGHSYPDTLGRSTFIGWLSGGAAGLYRIDPDGKLTLLLKTGMVTDLGTITHIADADSNPPAYWTSLNRHDQVAVVVRFDRGPNTLVLLTPTTP